MDDFQEEFCFRNGGEPAEASRQQKTEYYTLFPAQVRHDKRLSPMARIIFTDILFLSSQTGYCFASNRFFADTYEANLKTVSGWVAELKKAGYIRAEEIRGGDGLTGERRLYPLVGLTAPGAEGYPEKDGGGIRENAEGASAKRRRGYPEKDGGGIREKTEHNITREILQEKSIYVTASAVTDTHSTIPHKEKKEKESGAEKSVAKGGRAAGFERPSQEEARGYFREIGAYSDGMADAFFDYYESKGWLVGKTPMKDWKAAARNWKRNEDKGMFAGHGRGKESPVREFDRIISPELLANF